MKNYYKIDNALKKNAIDFINVLQARFPHIFPEKPAPKVPLKVGIFYQLRAELKVPFRLLAASLTFWCNGKRYWSALSETGVSRYDINGRARGVVTEDHAETARKMLEKKPRMPTYFRRP